MGDNVLLVGTMGHHAQRKMNKDEEENRDAYVAMGNAESDDD